LTTEYRKVLLICTTKRSYWLTHAQTSPKPGWDSGGERAYMAVKGPHGSKWAQAGRGSHENEGVIKVKRPS